MDNYGNGPSTGQIQSGVRRVSTLFNPEDLHMSTEDRQVLRTLAQRVATIADSPEMVERRELWRKINALEKTRPAILCEPENGWNEIITEGQMQCKGHLARHWEMDLRKALEMTRDNVVEVIMKDNHTLGKRPENAVEWSRMAKEEARRVSGM